MSEELLDEEPQPKEREKSGGGDGPPSDAWMSTFSDLLMLMLTFFVLLLTMSSLDAQKLEQAMHAGKIVDNGLKESSTSMIPAIMPNQRPTTRNQNEAFEKTESEEEHKRSPLNMGQSPDRLRLEIDKSLAKYKFGKNAWVEMRPSGLMVALEGQVAFEPGSTRLTQKARDFIDHFSGIARATLMNVEVESYYVSAMDPKGPETRDADWQLALRRADSVAQRVERGGINSRHLKVIGYGLASGAREGRFLRQRELLSLAMVSGEPGAESR